MVRFFKLLGAVTRASLLRQLAFRTSFWLAVITKMLRLAIQVLFFSAIFSHVPSLGHWTFDQVLLIVATANLLLTLGVITFHRNLMYWVSEDVRNGAFDFRLTKPVSPLFMSSLREIDCMDLVSMVSVLALLVVVLVRLQVNVLSPEALAYGLFLAVAYVFYLSLFLIAGATVFWTVTGQGMGRFMEGIIKLAAYPPDVLGSPLGTILSFVIPIALIAVVPSQALLGVLSIPTILGFLVLALVWFAAARWFWGFGLKRYSSASS